MWLLITSLIALAFLPLYKKKTMSKQTYIALLLLVFYLCFVFQITIIKRIPENGYQYELQLFWSYRAIAAGKKDLIIEIILNIILFIPIGALFSSLLKKRWPVPLIGTGISFGIELTQLITKRGLFEFDDVFHNTLGTLLGLSVAVLVYKNVIGDSETS